MAAILNFHLVSATSILDSDTFLSCLRFTQKNSHSILILTQTNSWCLKLIHFHLIDLWQSSWILPSWIQTSALLEFRHLVFFSQIHSKTSPSTLTLTQTNSFWLKLIHSHWTWWWQPSWILPTAILDSDTLLSCSDSLKNIGHSTLILTQTNSNWLKLDDGSHLEYWPSWIHHLVFSFCIVKFRHLVFFSQIHSKTLSLHSDSDPN